MRYAILGDIHANLSALETVLGAIEKLNVQRILSVGDVVGYGAAPRRCIRILRDLDAVVVKGNHDAACVGDLDMTYFNPYARSAAEWTREVLENDDIAWLKSLPMTIDLDHCSVAHGTLSQPERYDYIQCPQDADPSLDEMQRKVCFVGHTHVPVTIMRYVDDPYRTAYTTESEIHIKEVVRALVNVGSVGQPRDENCDAAYAIYDTDEGIVTIHRIPYDIETEANRIRSAGLPPMLADRLYLGV
ncbi:MAG: diadenosine tetraphosphatase ApaH/serine/threonine PP2A family protein phosphatase [Planctomycetota bacterium]|jgi:diadenosine tetraphosphatase ApaH/serine/threonine PP2A family protein phosphatase